MFGQNSRDVIYSFRPMIRFVVLRDYQILFYLMEHDYRDQKLAPVNISTSNGRRKKKDKRSPALNVQQDAHVAFRVTVKVTTPRRQMSYSWQDILL